MKGLNPYLNFDGNAAEAMRFYQSCLEGSKLMMQTFGEAPIGASEEHKNRLMHGQLTYEGMCLMASDTMPGQPLSVGNNVQLSLNLEDQALQEKIFNKLAEGGTITMPLQDTFWNARFGMLTDKFGINWLLNCEKPEQN
jgi:PhnB protein